MRNDKETAFKLRKTGKSYREIRSLLSVPLSTLSDWFRNQKWSNNLAMELAEKSKTKSTIRLKELSRIRGEHLDKLYKEAEIEAVQEFQELKYHPLFIAGVVIYWGEGDKVGRGAFRVTNSDSSMLRLFVDFLIKVCRVDQKRIRLGLILYPDIDHEQAVNYWSREVGLDRSHFTKCVEITGRHKTKRLKYGICLVSFSSTYLKCKMMVWIKLLSQELIKM